VDPPVHPNPARFRPHPRDLTPVQHTAGRRSRCSSVLTRRQRTDMPASCGSCRRGLQTAGRQTIGHHDWTQRADGRRITTSAQPAQACYTAAVRRKSNYGTEGS
jgi:hypothetical protein